MSIQKPRGTNDLVFDSIDKFNYVCDFLKVFSQKYCFNEIETPIFEHLELFTKNIGESTDVVEKEIYSFVDKSNRKIALRPEGTAGVIRAYVENKIYGNKSTVTKFFYLSKLYRYERPQNGRYREFHQFGVEYLGTKSDYDLLECIVFADSILKSFNLKGKYVLKINNIGDFEDRQEWVNALKKYFNNNKKDLSETSIDRIEKNPLRIIDDKEDSVKDVVKLAPKISQYLSDEKKEKFNWLTNKLTQLGIAFEVEESLVRGLDYYTDTVFEFVSTSESLGKSTIIGGGEYGQLIKKTGGPDQQGIGFAIGIERLIHILSEENLFPENIKLPPKYLIATKDKENELFVLALSCKLRNIGVCVNCLFDETKPQKISKFAKDNNINHIIWINNDSYEKQYVTIEDLIDNKKDDISLDDLTSSIKGA